MTSTDLKPGDLVQHAEFGPGLVGGGKQILYLARDGFVYATFDPTGWERVETCTADERSILNDFREVASGEAQEAVYPEEGVVIASHADFEQRPELVRPGHVQVRVDDLADELRRYAALGQGPACLESNVMLRVTRALDAQRAESTPPADEPETVGDGCECWVTPEHMWTTYGSAVEPGSQSEYNPRCPKHGDKPTSAMVTLFCPDCGEAVTDTATVGIEDEGGYYLTFANSETHTCPPAQPDEPTEFGARVTVTLPDGTREKWLRQVDGWWVNEQGGSAMWKHLIKRGTVTIGWDE